METGERERGLDELETIVQELPFSYYMLQAYTQLRRLAPDRAVRARQAGIERSERQPFRIEHPPELETPGFRRAMELLSVGEVERGKREIEGLKLAHRGTAPKILWGISLLYAKAGSADLSHRVARSLLTDWLQRWPAGDWTQAWTLAYPRPYLKIVEREAKLAKIPVPLAYGVMREESAFDPVAHSPANAYGLMQLIVPTARHYGRKAGLPWTAAALKNPRTNIALGCRVLGDLTERFEKNPLLAIPGYNAGPGRPSRWAKDRTNADFDLWVELIPFRETRRYTKRVLASRATYAFLYSRERAEDFMALPTKLGY
jgi:soluble lytic murein transglycosylase